MRRCGALAGVVLVVGLAACSGSDVPNPRDVALDTCQDMAVRQYDLSSAGDDVQVREVSVEAGDAFEVTGASDGVEWICTWTSTRTDDGARTEATIDRR